MKKTKNKIIMCITSLCVLCCSLFTSSNALGLSIKHYTDTKTRQLISRYRAHIGLIISNNKGQIQYQKNAQSYFNSASILKLFTASAAILSLGENFKFKTQLLVSGYKKNTILNGNVYLHFSGDPDLTFNDIKNLFQQLKSHGIRKITGDIVLDDNQFNHTQYPPGTAVDDLAYSYASPIDAMTINENKFGITINPKRANASPKLLSSLPSGTVHFNNQLVSTKKNKDCDIIIRSDGHNHYSLSGCVPITYGKQAESLAIRDIFSVANIRIHRILQKENIVLAGNIIRGQAPINAKRISTHKSKPLKSIIKDMLKDSDNLVSNTLIKAISFHSNKTQGSFTDGLKRMKKILHRTTGIQFKHTHIQDGAGLSMYNLITPKQVLKLLIAIHKNPILKRTILPALPIAGIDGTLSGRMHLLAKKRRLRAKTGTLTGVSNIAGYCNTQHHGKLMFVIMVDQYINKAKPIRYWANQYLTTLALK